MSDIEQYIFGYGSLIESQSRMMTAGTAMRASPVVVAGIQRGWFGRLDGGSWSPTYLAAVSDPHSKCNGVVFKVSTEQLAAFDEHETGYGRERIDPNRIAMLDDTEPPIEAEVWFYTCAEKRFASPEFPILQSYVDTCLNGCLELEATFPLAKAAEFAEEFLRSSTGWSKHWVNDRDSTRMALRQQPDPSRIDELIRKVLGEAMLSNIDSWQGRLRVS